MFEFQIAKFARVGEVGPAGLSVTDVRELQKRLKEIDPKLRTALVRDAKAVAKQPISQIKSAIAKVTPNSGLLRPGARLNWNSAIDAKGRSHSATDVKPQFRTSRGGKDTETSLVRIRVANPAVVLADMGGRSGRFVDAGYKGSGYTREYSYKGGTRRHKVNGQFKGIENKIGGRASRFVWPAAEDAIPSARAAIEKILRDAYTRINQKGI